MKIEMYDTIETINGEIGQVVEIFKTALVVDIEVFNGDRDYDTRYVEIEDVLRVVKRM